jgi:hypothetical protein
MCVCVCVLWLPQIYGTENLFEEFAKLQQRILHKAKSKEFFLMITISGKGRMRTKNIKHAQVLGEELGPQ